jgi:hypothetical protein
VKYVLGPNRRGVELSLDDLKLLRHLAIHRLVSIKQLYAYVCSKKEIPYSTFRHKLYRWRKYDLVVSHPYTLGQKGFYFNYYRIGKQGVSILINEGLLPQSWMDVEIKKFSNVKNIDHYLATQEVVTQTLIELEGVNEEVESIFPHDSPYLDRDNGSKLVIPDWILKNGERYLNLEIDTGSESPMELRGKVERYITLAKQNPSDHHIVLFAVIDDSFTSRYSYGEDRTRRIGSIKKNLLNIKDLHMPNIDVYVVPLARAHKLAFEILYKTKPQLSFDKELETIAGIEILSNHPKFPFYIKKIEDSVYPQNINTFLQGDGHYRINTQSGSYSENVLFVVMEEGNVKDLDRLSFLASVVEEKKLNISFNRIIVLYKNDEELINDVFGLSLSNIWCGSRESWKNMNGDLNFYVLSSPFKLEVSPFEKGIAF